MREKVQQPQYRKRKSISYPLSRCGDCIKGVTVGNFYCSSNKCEVEDAPQYSDYQNDINSSVTTIMKFLRGSNSRHYVCQPGHRGQTPIIAEEQLKWKQMFT